MDSPLQNQAIQSALNQDWKSAIRFNEKLLKENDKDVETLNRLAFAHLKAGHLNLAKNTYNRVLKIDKYNPIASKNLKWLIKITRKDIHYDASSSPTPNVFLEEPGKTKIVTLVNPASTKILCNIMTAQQVKLVPKSYSIEIRDKHDMYIGGLPDDISHRLLKFIAAGNTYEVYIKNVERNNVSVFIRETHKGKKLSHSPSFSLIQ